MTIDWPVQSLAVWQVDGPIRVMFGRSTPAPITLETLNTLLSQLCRLEKQIDRDVRWPLLIAREEGWVAKLTAKGVAPWADPAYGTEWLAAFRKRPEALSTREAWLSWDARRQKQAA